MDDIEAQGPKQTEVRDVADFNAIVVHADSKLIINVGAERIVRITAAAANLKRTTVEVRDKTLYLKYQRDKWWQGGGGPPITAEISIPRLTSLRVAGGNDVRLNNAGVEFTDLKIEGATHLEATGKTERLSVHMAGAGHADLRNLLASDATVVLEGVGNLVVNSKQSLRATMNGVGAIQYAGEPVKLTKKVNGLGSISQL